MNSCHRISTTEIPSYFLPWPTPTVEIWLERTWRGECSSRVREEFGYCAIYSFLIKLKENLKNNEAHIHTHTDTHTYIHTILPYHAVGGCTVERRCPQMFVPRTGDRREIDRLMRASGFMYIYAVPRGAASNAAVTTAGRRLGIARPLFSNASTAWEATAFPPRMVMARRCCRSATAATVNRLCIGTQTTTTTTTTIITIPNNNTARSPKPNHAVSLLPPWSPPPRSRPRPRPPSPPSSATATHMILVISSKVWERSGWWLRRSHGWRGKGENQVGIRRGWDRFPWNSCCSGWWRPVALYRRFCCTVALLCR